MGLIFWGSIIHSNIEYIFFFHGALDGKNNFDKSFCTCYTGSALIEFQIGALSLIK
jgi:hypothetical protein